MLTCLSPAKNLDFASDHAVRRCTQPQFLERSGELIGRLRSMSTPEIGRLIHLSDRLSSLNAARYKEWSPPFDKGNARPCIMAFAGDVYRGLEAGTLEKADLDFAQRHLRILSGLHGLLRPLDLIQPYRLEMGTRLGIAGHNSLYSFWGDSITDALADAMKAARTEVLVNLASEEYFKAVRPDRLSARIIQPVFKDKKNGKYGNFFVYTKRARGMMSRFIITGRLTDPESLKAFDVGGYRFNPTLSDGDRWAFTREHARV